MQNAGKTEIGYAITEKNIKAILFDKFMRKMLIFLP